MRYVPSVYGQLYFERERLPSILSRVVLQHVDINHFNPDGNAAFDKLDASAGTLLTPALDGWLTSQQLVKPKIHT